MQVPHSKPAEEGWIPQHISEFDQSVLFHSINIRNDPSSYIVYLEEKLTKFNGNLYNPGTGINLMTNEGPAAVHEAIDFLKK